MFSSLVLIALLGAPLIHLFQALPALGSAQACFGRVHAFLQTPEMLPAPMRDGPRPTMNDQRTNPDTAPACSDSFGLSLSVRDASFGWCPEKSVLQGVHLEVKRGSIVAITGKSGCGKSLLLKAIVGEAKVVCGSIAVRPGSIAYCAQAPWLENTSAEKAWNQYARQDPGWHIQVLAACLLNDITSLTDYRTGNIGSGGMRLSGGQRQRLVTRIPLLARTWGLGTDKLMLIGPCKSNSIPERYYSVG